MAKLTGFCAAFALSTALTLPAFAEGETAATVIATVNGTEITLGQMIALRESLPPQYLSLPDDVLFNGVLEQLIQQEVLAQSHTTLSTRDEANVANERRSYISGVVIQNVVTSAVTEEALQKAYDERFKDAKPQTEYNAAHILVDSEEKAKELKAQIDGGADFAELAKANSTDVGSGSQGGDLGWFGLGMMVKPFEDAVVAAEVGKVTEPVKSDFGYHLVLVKETRVAEQPTLDEIREELAAEIENKAIEDKIGALTEAAKVERPGAALDSTLLKKAELID